MCCPRLQMSPWICTVLPRRRTLPSGGRRDSSETSFCLVFITDRRPHSTIYRWRPSLSRCHCSCNEQFAKPHHFCTFNACLPFTPRASPLPHFPPQLLTVQCHTMTSCHFRHSNRSCYLLDDKLSWKKHIEYIYSKLAKFVGIFYKLSHKLPDDCLKMCNGF